MLQAAQVRYSREMAVERKNYLELYGDLQRKDDQVQAHHQAANEVQAQLVQVQALTYSLLCPFVKDAIV